MFATGPDILAKELDDFRRATSDASRSDAEVAELARGAFSSLFSDASERKIILSAKHLVIAPDGPLWGVPFAALVVNPKGPADYLGDHVAITYTQSFRLYEEARAAQARLVAGQPPSVLVVGGPLPAPGVESLPASLDEAKRVARLYGDVKPLTGADATKAAVLKTIEKADVIHFAAHATLDPTVAMSSSILLAPPRSSDRPASDDARLQAWEVFSQLRLRAELVVLSGCETAWGDPVRAEGMVGLTRAFQYAGARSVVASQWRVEDESTAILMEAFHRFLRQGLSKDTALQQAMKEARKTKPSPYYWASFILLGAFENPDLGITGAATAATTAQ